MRFSEEFSTEEFLKKSFWQHSLLRWIDGLWIMETGLGYLKLHPFSSPPTHSYNEINLTFPTKKQTSKQKKHKTKPIQKFLMDLLCRNTVVKSALYSCLLFQACFSKSQLSSVKHNTMLFRVQHLKFFESELLESSWHCRLLRKNTYCTDSSKANLYSIRLTLY